MSGVQNTIIETLPHLPVGVENPQALGLLAVGAAAYVGIRAAYDRTDTSAYVEFSNSALLQDVVHPAPEKARRSTLRSTALTAIGLTALGIGFIGQPYTEQTEVTDKAATVVILDESFSMSKTQDISQQTRLEAARTALQTTATQDGQMAIIESGANSVVAMPMSDNWTQQKIADTLAVTDRVDPNGTNMVDAITLGSTIMPADAEKKTIVIVSDGTVQDALADIQTTSDQLQANGITVEVIAIGTPSAEYQLSTSSPVVQSGVQTDKLQELDDNVMVVSTPNDLNIAVGEVLESTNKVPVKKRWYGLEVVGGALAALGIGRLVKKAIVGR